MADNKKGYTKTLNTASKSINQQESKKEMIEYTSVYEYMTLWKHSIFLKDPWHHNMPVFERMNLNACTIPVPGAWI